MSDKKRVAEPPDHNLDTLFFWEPKVENVAGGNLCLKKVGSLPMPERFRSCFYEAGCEKDGQLAVDEIEC